MLAEAEAFQLELITPKNFNGEDPANYTKKLDLSFEALCTSLEELGVKDPGELSVFSFYAKIAYFKKKQARQQKKP